MLNGGSEAGVRVETQAATAYQAFANPEAISIAEGGVGSGNLVFLTGGHSPSLTALLLGKCTRYMGKRAIFFAPFRGSH